MASATCCSTPTGASFSRRRTTWSRVSFLDRYNLAELLDGLWLSTRVAFLGFAIAIVIGILLAIAMSQARWVERSLYPYAVMSPPSGSGP